MRGIRVDGERLRTLREQKVWLIEDLARESSVHRNTISRIENEIGTSSPDTIRKIAAALRVEPSELVAVYSNGAGRGLPRVVG